MKVALALGLSLFLVMFSRSAAGQERQVLLTTAGDPAEASALALVVRDLMGRLEVDLTVSSAESIDPSAIINRPRGFPPALARAWIDLTPDDHAMLYLADAPWERVLIRRVRREPGHLEVAREELGHILETAVEAMLGGARIGIDRSALAPREPEDVTPEPVRPPDPPAPKTGPIALRFGVYEQVSVFSDAVALTNAFGLSGVIETPTAARFGIWVTCDYRLPIETHSRELGVRLQGIETRALGRAAVWRSSHWSVELGFGAGADVMVAEAVANRSGKFTLTPNSADASLVMRGALGVRWASVLGLWLIGDADVTNRSYPFQLNGRETVAFTPYRLRPGLLLEATFH